VDRDGGSNDRVNGETRARSKTTNAPRPWRAPWVCNNAVLAPVRHWLVLQDPPSSSAALYTDEELAEVFGRVMATIGPAEREYAAAHMNEALDPVELEAVQARLAG
jgi:hypothetical protein